ncbi:hypothetical protein A1Q2_02349 [Trichosporon asahii var. asahii CBS 8904]|uniref:Inhibitor I9 domain-containing protein n=1 Tax=Trichosporon asahii var. asahii (strain CBS 8904) TaxID=1220162 RepID=K1WQN8_TRIAC|nr:hypothetical protein A1Q2_02349 [Trichosporon asahii var. asahii CBS 8904]
MGDNQCVIKFKKDASPESKQKTLDQIKKDGGKILKDDNVNNPIFSYAVAEISPDQFKNLSQSCADGHDCLDRVEEDKTMSI